MGLRVCCTNRRIDEWRYTLILTYIMSAHALGGWAGFVDSLIRWFVDSLFCREDVRDA